MNDILKEIENVVYECGKIMLNAKLEQDDIEVKDGIGNFVTYYDKYIENYLKEKLSVILPQAQFLGEEGENNITDFSGYVFVVDPIDGTANFMQNFHHSAISVGLLKDKKPYLGVCYDPYNDEMFVGLKGYGAYLNGEKISVSNKKLNEGLLIVGSASYYPDIKEKSINYFVKMIGKALDYRRFASAVLDICYIACGRAEVFYEARIQPWDFTGASIILSEAGGLITTIEGNEIDYTHPSSILATNNVEDYKKYFLESGEV